MANEIYFDGLSRYAYDAALQQGKSKRAANEIASRLRKEASFVQHIFDVEGIEPPGIEYFNGLPQPIDLNRVEKNNSMAPIIHNDMVPKEVFNDQSFFGAPITGFTQFAYDLLTLAQQEAIKFNHNYIGTEHIILGLLRVENSIAGLVLQNLGVELAKVRVATEFLIGRGGRPVDAQGFTPRSEKVLQLARDEAARKNDAYIGTEHILVGLVKEGDGIASGVLESLNVNTQRVESGLKVVVGQLTNQS